MKKLNLLLVLLFCQFIVFGKDGKKALPNSLQQPFAFVENNGQIRDGKGNPRKDIDFILKTPDLTLFIGSGALHYQFTKIQGSDATGPLKTDLPKAYHSAEQVILYRLDMTLKDANRNATVVKESEQKTQYHYYTQPEDQNGITHVRSYQKIIYQNIYPNIDWVLYTKGQQLKYDFIVHPGGKLSDIRMVYDGAENITLLKDGDLSIRTPFGKILEEAPHSYEQESGQVVSSRFALSGDNNVHFETGDYQGALVIDPGVDWGTYFGGGQKESAEEITSDADGNIYLVGNTSSTYNIATTGAHQTLFSGTNGDAYLAKFDSTGQLKWATYYGGSAESGFYIVTQATSVSTDRFGHIFLAGFTSADTGIATPSTYQSTLGSNSFLQGFLVQFKSDGTREWGTYYGASIDTFIFTRNYTRFYAVACDSEGNVYAAGQTDSLSSTDISMTTSGAQQLTYGGGSSDGLLVKFDSTGSRLWATYYGGNNSDNIFDVVCDDNNNVYIAGSTNSDSAIATSGTLEGTFHSAAQGFIAKLNSDGIRQWGTYLHGGWIGVNLALDTYNHIYASATTQGGLADSLIFTPGCHQSVLQSASSYDENAFLIQFNQSDGTRNWGTYYSADNHAYANGLACDQSGNVYLGGHTNAYSSLTPGQIATPGSHQDFLNATPGLFNPPNDAFIVQFDSSGVRKWASYYGGSGDDSKGGFLTCDPTGAIYMAGTTKSNAGIATLGAYQDTLSGSSDAFLVRWLPNDIALQSVEYPTLDTVCTGLTPLSIQVSNKGRMNKTDTLKISYSFTGLVSGAADTFYTGGLPAGTTDTFQLPNLNFPVPGTYELTVFLHYTQDDNNFENDTLHFSLMATNAQPVADIQINQVGTQYHFSNPSGQSSDNYYWNFGDGDTSTAANPTHEYTTTDSYLVTLIITGYCGTDTATQMIHAIGTGTNIGSLSLPSNLMIYPNPAGQTLFIKTAKDIRVEAYTITNNLGQKVLSGDLKSNARIDIRSLASGSYFIKIKTNNGIVNRPFQVLQQ